MGPVRENPIQRTVSLFIGVCIALCTIVAHNIAQNRPDSFPPYPPDNHHISDDVYLREGGCITEHSTVLIIFSLILQTTITAQMSTGGILSVYVTPQVDQLTNIYRTVTLTGSLHM